MLLTINNLEKDLKLKQIEIGRLNTDKNQLERKVDKEHRSALRYQMLLEDAKTPLQIAQAEIESLKKDLISAHRQEMNLSKDIDRLMHEKELQLKATERAEIKSKENENLYEEKARSISNLTQEMQSYRDEVQKLRRAIFQLEKDREKLSNSVTEQHNLYLSSQEELKLREISISELNKRVNEWELKLKQQQQLYEAVRSDRNHYSKTLLESQDEIAELRKKFKIMGHQIEQLKEEIATKDQSIVKEHFEFQRVDKLRENIQNELIRKNQLITSNHELIHQQENELKNLTSTLKQMDEEALAQRKEYDQVINERDILGTLLIRRNDELALLYEKIRIQQSALKKGEAIFGLCLFLFVIDSN